MKRKHSDQFLPLEPLEPRCLLSAAVSTTLLQDGFNGNKLNTVNWYQPPYNPAGSTYLGRTQLQVLGSSPVPKVGGGRLQLTLQSYNPTMLPDQPSFWGTEVLSRQTLSAAPGKTLDIQVRAKLNAMPGGGVLGVFLYTVNPDGNHDEIDTEIESNQIASGENQVETNVYADQPLGAGSPALFTLPTGGKLTGWHTYEMKLDAGVVINGITLTPSSVSWHVDGKLIRTESNTIPTDPMQLYLNFWAPDQGWAEAYNAGIQPTSDPKQNQLWTANIDSVTVKSVTDTVPLTVWSASVNVGSPQVVEGHSDTAAGVILGAGTGHVKYDWLVKEPNGNVIQASGTLTATMTDGAASIKAFAGLPSYYAGAYSTWVNIVSPGSGLDSAVGTYVVAGASPGILISSVPSLGSGGNARGRVVGVNPADYQGVAVFIEVAGQWWTKPYWNAPVTKIASNGGWSANIDTGGDDQDATEVVAFVVPLGFDVPLCAGDSSLPDQLFSLLYTESSRG